MKKELKIKTYEYEPKPDAIIQGTRYFLEITKPNGKRPFDGGWFRTAEARQAYIDKAVESFNRHTAYMQELRDARKNYKVPVEVGDIMVASWGYDQTNIDWYQVIELRGKNTVIVREIAGTSEDQQSFDSAKTRPVKDKFIGEPTRHIMTSSYIKIDDVRSASKWDGRARYYSWGH